ncbi:Clp protease N-terminal domain-containing protein [Nocardia stercoris]|uniref:Clp protease n=1 Tax=Nocardia stercoris TaxID=2483361 RepID=A0A3M2L8J2_9NOCA|nr:Clp protease N-terminal domain-containing protein [Nocardia stercoris]RMI30888.1 Clp protease [Nocardia stercoris]
MFERFAKTARHAVVVAQEEARELRTPRIGAEHLLLGLVACPDEGLRATLAADGVTADSLRTALYGRRTGEPLGEADAAALKSIGIDLDAVRDSLESVFGADALERAVPAAESRRSRFLRGGSVHTGHIPFAEDAKKALELGLREAVSRGDKTIEAGHLVLGIVRAPGPVVTELLGGPDGVRRVGDSVRTFLDRAA